MEKKFNSNASLRATQAGGVRAAANVMNYLKSNVEASVMKELTKKDKDIAKEIQENMFDFENLGYLNSGDEPAFWVVWLAVTHWPLKFILTGEKNFFPWRD